MKQLKLVRKMNNLKKIAIPFLVLSILLYVVMYFFYANTFIESFSLNTVFWFHFLISLAIILLVYFIYLKFPEHVAYGFLGATLLKIMVIAIFLLPHVKGEIIYPKTDLYFFSVPYFLYLFYEVFFVMKLLSKKI